MNRDKYLSVLIRKCDIDDPYLKLGYAIINNALLSVYGGFNNILNTTALIEKEKEKKYKPSQENRRKYRLSYLNNKIDLHSYNINIAWTFLNSDRVEIYSAFRLDHQHLTKLLKKVLTTKFDLALLNRYMPMVFKK